MLKHKGGFTIIELLIVIAVVAILTAIFVPNFSSLDSQKETLYYDKCVVIHDDVTEFLDMYNKGYHSRPRLDNNGLVIGTTEEYNFDYIFCNPNSKYYDENVGAVIDTEEECKLYPGDYCVLLDEYEATDESVVAGLNKEGETYLVGVYLFEKSTIFSLTYASETEDSANSNAVDTESTLVPVWIKTPVN